jgi:NO-binding membrane sensor protein with MHYT domain
MGGTAIWCMHFVGNRAIELGSGEQFPQIVYSPKFTAVSFFLPIIVFFFAFWAVGSNEEPSIVRVTLGGLLAGSGICGMHYLGQAGISNYDCLYAVGKGIGAAIIAAIASIAALGIFFIWRSTWDTSWWKRGICAVILSGAVSGMHWLASIGTRYRLRVVNMSLKVNTSRNNSIIIAIVLVS